MLLLKLRYPCMCRYQGSTLYVGLTRAVSPTNSNFRLNYLLTRLQEALYEDLPVKSIKFEVYHQFSGLCFIAEVKFLAPVKNSRFLRFIPNILIIIMIIFIIIINFFRRVFSEYTEAVNITYTNRCHSS